MRELFKDKEHLFRMAGLFGVGLLVFVVLRGVLIPADFGDLGHYRASALDDIPHRSAKNQRVQGISNNRRPVQLLLATTDTAFLVVGGLVAAWIRFGSALFSQELGLILDHPGFIAYAIFAQLGLAIAFDLYRPESWRTRDYLLARMAAFGISLAIALYLLYLPTPPPPLTPYRSRGNRSQQIKIGKQKAPAR